MFAERKETQPRAQCRTQLASAKTAMPPDLLHFAAHHRKSAVCSLHRPNRTETKRPSPLLVGLGRVYLEPKALAGGTAAPPARGADVLFSVRHPGARGKEGAVPCDAALPRWGKGRCRCARSTLFAPAGQKRFRVARRIWAGSWERAFCRALCPSGGLSRRAGERKAGSHFAGVR